MHQYIPAALFAGLDDVALEFLQFALAWMDDSPLCLNRHKAGRSQLREFFDQELGTVSLQKWSGDLQLEGELGCDGFNAGDLKVNVSASNRENLGGVLAAVTVEEANLVAGAKPANCSQMVSLGALELNRPGGQWAVDVKSFGHPC
jgi:hypothetical protein